MVRLQRKPVLLVTPRVAVPELQDLRDHLNSDRRGKTLLASLEAKIPLKPNPNAIPSLWYMPLLGGQNFFDGFGFGTFGHKFGWKEGPLDRVEKEVSPQRPLLPFLVNLRRGQKPKRFSLGMQMSLNDDDWLVWDIRRKVKAARPR